ncbi:replication factor A C-terminal domain-containing protein [Elsinoe australis]|uniref:Replication protein A subunit n=1 Tax=Elsinoe australis TaxID=40998 RepID=A0A4V6DV58_9PEZI|nr:replication factor A C-terminal domain-containing protein [Elsinoe australis]
MADPMEVLSVGCLRRVFAGEEVTNPIVQCVQIKPMQNQANGVERFRVVFNDTHNFIQSMIAQQTNWIVTEGKLKKGSLCRLKAFQANSVKDKPILVILDLDVLEEYGETEKIGQPVALDMIKGENQEETKPQVDNISGNNFYGNKPAQQPQQQQTTQQRSLPSRTNGASSAHGNIYPIEALSPYTHKWTIKARCTHKGPIKEWHNKNGQGKLFSANFLDATGEIRATGFTDSVDTFYELIQEGSVYYISSPCRINLAKRQFSNVNNDYELTFERDTAIEKAEDNEGVPQVTYNFTRLADLESVEKDTTIDCIGILQGVGEVSEVVSKTTSKPFSKRELTIADNTGYSVRLTIWGATAQSFNAAEETVIAFKGVKVSDFGGRSLSLLSSGSMSLDPDIDEAHALKGWYDAQGRNENYQTHANTIGNTSAATNSKNALKTIAQIRDENLGMSEEADYFNLKGTIVYVKQDSVAYPACLTPECNKKVIEVDPGEWRCEKCNVSHPRPEYRYIMSINVADHTGMLWLSCFDEVGRMVMGVPADVVMAAKEEGDERKVQDLFQDANCKNLVFRCRAKMDTFQDQQRVRYQVLSAAPVNFAQEAKKLADLLKQYSLDGDSLFVN